MKRGWLGVLAVAAAAAGIIAVKQLAPRRGSARPAARSAAMTNAGPTVLLFANLGEADSSCGCGQIIRLVHDVGSRGVAVREISVGSETALEREHRVTVTPTVLLVGADGRELARHEGESPGTIAEIRSALDGLSRARP